MVFPNIHRYLIRVTDPNGILKKEKEGEYEKYQVVKFNSVARLAG